MRITQDLPCRKRISAELQEKAQNLREKLVGIAEADDKRWRNTWKRNR